MFGIGMPELLVILGLALVILGPKKLPGIARGLGRAIREFKDATNEMRESFQEETRELADIKDRIVGEMDRATEPDDEDEVEETAASEESAEKAAEESGAGDSSEDTEETEDIEDEEGGKTSTQEAGKPLPG